MKRIHFGNTYRKRSWVLIAFGILGIFCILNGAFEILEFENPNTNKYLNVFGYVLVIAISSQMFWYANYVQWNKRGILIRIKSFFGKNIKFNEIKAITLKNKKLIIRTTYDTEIEIELSHVVASDAIRLSEILKENTTANFK